MSLNREETRRTAEELQANLTLSGLTDSEVQADLGFTATRLGGALALSDHCDPADTWLLRDYLEQAVRDAGGVPRPFTVLTERSRSMAQVWFRLRPAPRHRFDGHAP